MIYNSLATIWKKFLSLHTDIKKEYIPPFSTILNTKSEFNIFPNINNISGEYPKQFSYYAIGVGGGSEFINNSGYSYNNHNPTDASLYEQIPFIMKTTDNDISVSEQSKYRFRTEKIINGITYICYYLKEIGDIRLPSRPYKLTVVNNSGMGDAELTEFDTNTDSMLYPIFKPRTIDPVSNNVANYVAVTLTATINFTPAEIQYLKEVLNILYPDQDKKITELAICSGIDLATEEGRIEAAIVQIMYFISIDTETAMALASTDGFNRTIEMGGLEPLI